jgi:hypothetical protein
MITFNISGLDEVQNKLAQIDIDKLCYKVAVGLRDKVMDRVHIEGKASDGSKIGEYSKGYMVTRTGAYKNAEVNVKGKSKGLRKNAGTYTEKAIYLHKSGVFMGEEKVGKKRMMYNRDSDKKVVLSLTRQMENDMGGTEPIKVDGGYGIGYQNELNYNKAIWNEKRYKKPIWDLTKEEEQLAEEVVSNYIDNLK